MTTATAVHDSNLERTLYLALELGVSNWKLALTIGLGQSPRVKTVPAGDLVRLMVEIAKAKGRFGLPPEARVVSCYEAGRDGFWLHRALLARGVHNHVVDSSSIEVNRRRRRAKSDGLDAEKLAEMLVRYELGEQRLWSVVQPPTPEQEDERQLHREIEIMQRDQRQLANRINGLLAAVGVSASVNARFGQRLPALCQPNGQALPSGLRQRVEWEFERWQIAHRQGLAAERELQRVAHEQAANDPHWQALLSLRGLGVKGSWMLLREELIWRQFRNRRELAAMVGLTPTPYHSGTIAREQGISKAGNARLRRLLVELAWGWLHYQPDSALTQWYRRRFGEGNARSRKVGIVALARKLLVAFWRLATQGEVPAGAATVDWQSKFSVRRAAAMV